MPTDMRSNTALTPDTPQRRYLFLFNAAGRASASTTAKEARASNAAGQASASTTATKRGASNASGGASASTTAKEAGEMAVMSTSENRDMTNLAMIYARNRHLLVFRDKTVGLNRGVSIVSF